MAFQIEDGVGSGKLAKVNDENHLSVEAVTHSRFSASSDNHGTAFSWTAVSADIDTGDTMLLVANNSTTQNLHINKIYVWADVPAQFKVHVPAYVTPAGTTVVGVNLNRTSGKVADATAMADETANVFAQANVITTVRNNEATADEFGQWIDYEGALILGYHQSVAVDIIGESAEFQCTITGFFHD